MTGAATPSLAKRSLHALAWSYLGAGLRICAQLVVQIGLARLLGPEAFGQASTVIVVMGIGWLLADAGLGAALIQKTELEQQDLAYTLGWVLVLSAVIGSGVYLLAPWLATLLQDTALVPLVRACAVLIPLNALCNIPLSLMRRELDMKRQQLVSLSSYVLGMGVVGLVLALIGFGAWALIVGLGVQLALALVLGYWLHPFSLRMRLRHSDKTFRNFGFSVLATNLANWSIENLDRLLVGRFWGMQSLGEYSAAGNLARSPSTVLVGTLQAVVFSSTARAQSDHQQVARGLVGAVCLVTLVSAPLFCFLAVQSSFFMHLLYGERWLGAAPLFAAMCLSIPSYAVLSIAGPMLWGLGAAKVEFQVQVLIAIATFGGYALLSGWPLTQAVWIVPLLSLLRTTAIVAALLPRLALSARTMLVACCGGVLLALAVSLAAWLGLIWAPGSWAGVVAGSGLAAFLCAALMHWFGQYLLVLEVRDVLIERSRHANWARYACAWLGLREGAAA